jgi:PST family polysaccharide transporter
MVLSNTYGTNYLIIVHRDKELRNITIICSVIGLLLAYPLVSLYSYLGAALTVLVSRFLLGTTTYLYAKKVSKQIGS